jgi:membrane-bound lytic murein transglycosylase A
LVWGLVLGLWASPAGARSARPGPAPEEIRTGQCDDLDPKSLVAAIEAELPRLRATAADPAARVGGVRLRLAEYARSTLEPLLALARRGRAALCAGLPQQFELHRLAGRERGHFSAYFHPLYPGSRTRRGRYQFPLYRRPPEPASQLTTAEILAGGLQGKELELCYLDSLGTALNVHIEGSATVQFDDGSEVNLTTDGNNGHPYTNPFKLARQDGVIPSAPHPASQEVSAAAPGTPGPAAGAAALPSPSPAPETEPQTRRSWTRVFFDQHPDLLRDYWAKNPHFVFFKPTPLRGTGKFGQLIAGRSVAVDAARVPLGAALWLRTEIASSVEKGRVRHTQVARLALAQDTGAAIRGMGRVDVFVGSGPAAQLAAAVTSRPGELYLIVKKPAKPGRAARAGDSNPRRH